jgi:hypothetical protein
MMELGHRETKPFRKRLELSVEENKSKTKGVRLSGDIAQHFYHLVKERIISSPAWSHFGMCQDVDCSTSAQTNNVLDYADIQPPSTSSPSKRR